VAEFKLQFPGGLYLKDVMLRHIPSIGEENFIRATAEIFRQGQGVHFNVWKGNEGAFVGFNVPLAKVLIAADGFNNPTIGFKLNQECPRAATNCAALVIEGLRHTNIEAVLFIENQKAIPKVNGLDLGGAQIGLFPHGNATMVLKSKPLVAARQLGCRHLGIRFDLREIGGICDLAKKGGSLKVWTYMESKCDIGAMREARRLSNGSLRFIAPYSFPV
jgi:hypothetical protein